MEGQVNINSCYVSMPFGRKTNPQTGGMVDFDAIYRMLIRPAAEAAGLSPLRADDGSFGGIVHKGVLEAVIGCDVFVADLTTQNPNVMYELGIRHALRRGATVLVASHDTRLPYDISYSRYVTYRLTPDGLPDETGLDVICRMLSGAIEQAAAGRNDSPIHEFFPDLQVELPVTLLPRRRTYPPGLRKKLATNKAVPPMSGSEWAAVEQDVKAGPDVDPTAILDLIKRYRDNADWDGVVRFAEDLDEPLRNRPEILQIVVLALNRRSHPGDRDRAIAMMNEVIAKTGGDSETFGILGRIYKDRYAESRDRADLDQAIASYRAGFEKQPSDYYPAINLINLLATVGDDKAKAELGHLVPQVREMVMNRVIDRPADFWELSTAVELAVLSNEWDEASELGVRMRAQADAPWMLETTLRHLSELGERAVSAPNRPRLERLIGQLRSEATVGE
jgi:hypothetical protein